MQLSSFGFSEILLIDVIPKMAGAKALDLSDARYFLKDNFRIQGTDDIEQIEDSEIIIITAGIPRKPGMKREELIGKNSQIIKEISKNIKRLCPQSIVIVVTNPLDAMTYLAIKETSLPVHRVLGMGLTLDRARLANLISEQLNVAVTDIEPQIIGSHGEGMLPLSRQTKIKGKPLDEYLSPEQISALLERTVQRGAEIVSGLGSGSAYFAPSAAICELTRVIAQDEKSILPASVYLNGEYGLKDLCIGLPCCLGRKGVEKIFELELNDGERAAFLKSAESIKKQISAISKKIS